LIGGRRNPWAGLYDPSRKSLRAARDFAAENLNVAAQYAGHLTVGDEETVSALAPGDGAVLRRGARRSRCSLRCGLSWRRKRTAIESL
jgi:hypothetical protein